MQARKEGWGLNCSLGSGWLDRNPDRNLRVECRNPLERVDRDADPYPFRAGSRISGVFETSTSRLAAESPLITAPAVAGAVINCITLSLF